MNMFYLFRKIDNDIVLIQFDKIKIKINDSRKYNLNDKILH